jgi:hypothetical protein
MKYWVILFIASGRIRKTEAVYKQAKLDLSPSRGREYFIFYELCEIKNLVIRDRILLYLVEGETSTRRTNTQPRMNWSYKSLFCPFALIFARIYNKNIYGRKPKFQQKL